MNITSDMDRFKKVFFEECDDLLDSVEENLRRLKEQVDPEIIHAIFRAIHTIKGGAGSFDLQRVIEFAHAYETLLDLLREQKIKIDDSLIGVLFKSCDVLIDLINAAKNEKDVDDAFALETLAQLRLVIDDNFVNNETYIKHMAFDSPPNKNKEVTYIIEFNPHQNLMHYGSDPILILNELKGLSFESDSFNITMHASHIPDLNDLLPNNLYISWEIKIATQKSKSAIINVFEFVSDLCDLNINCVGKEKLDDYVSINSDNSDMSSALEDIISEPPSNPEKPLTKDIYQTDVLNSDENIAKKSDIVHSLRVEIDRIDKLVNTVGEIVIKQAMLLNQTKDLDDIRHLGIINGLNELSQYTRELQENVMAIRAQPIKSVFNRMHRLVRDLSSQLNKNITLETRGEDTELDKTVIENLSEPLMHMIRNAIDHGIENTEERLIANKPKEGKIILSAEHKNGRVNIQIKDDGRGINREHVYKKAIEKGLIMDDVILTDVEIDNLILLPGFSTAQKITNISGRGVGLDVVRKSIQSLGGKLQIQSHEGKGCEMTLSLPLTLAVMDGMIICCGNVLYIIPFVNISEILTPEKEQIINLASGDQLLKIRDDFIPLFSLKNVFNLECDDHNTCPRIVVVIEKYNGEHAGIIADDLQGKQQIVIKSLETNYESIAGIAATTIMGDGSVATILDVDVICDLKKIKTKNKEKVR
jgi:two-component system chemotaxis sensor kinase CheA